MPSKRFTFLRKTIDSIEILEMTQIAGDGGEVMFLRHYDTMHMKIDM